MPNTNHVNIGVAKSKITNVNLNVIIDHIANTMTSHRCLAPSKWFYQANEKWMEIGENEKETDKTPYFRPFFISIK